MITVLRDQTESGDPIFRAVLGERSAVGKTVGSAVDALAEAVHTNYLDNESFASNLIWVQKFQADRFFTEPQRERLSLLMAKWRAADGTGTSLSEADRAELEHLIEAETFAMRDRTAAFMEVQK